MRHADGTNVYGSAADGCLLRLPVAPSCSLPLASLLLLPARFIAGTGLYLHQEEISGHKEGQRTATCYSLAGRRRLRS